MSLGALRERNDFGHVVGFDDQRLSKLKEIIRRNSLMLGDFTLSSGRKSHYLFQLRQATLHCEGSLLIADLIVDFMRRRHLTCVGGMVQGAVPIVSSVAPVSFQKDYPIEVFFVRKKAKDHGARELVDGYMNRDADVLLVDDVTTTGNSMLDAVKAMTQEGYRRPVTMALSIVDREEGAFEMLAGEGIELFSLFKKSDFGL